MPSDTLEIHVRINALSRSGLSLPDIMASNPEAASTINTFVQATVRAAKANDDNSLTDQAVSGGTAIAQTIGARVSKNASMVFGVAGAFQSLRDNRPAQAAIDMVNGLPGIGVVLSEVLQLIGSKIGLDVEPSTNSPHPSACQDEVLYRGGHILHIILKKLTESLGVWKNFNKKPRL